MGRHHKADETPVDMPEWGSTQWRPFTARATGRDYREPFTPVQWVLTVFLIVAGIATAVGVWVLWPEDTPANVAPEFATTSPLPQNQVDGVVAVRDQGSCNSPSVGRVFDQNPVAPLAGSQERCERAIVDITSGQNAGKRTLLMIGNHPGDPTLEQGQQIRMAEQQAADGSVGYSFTDYQRKNALLFWAILTALAIIVVGAWRGARSLLGLTITLAAVGFFLLPALLRGGDPLALAVVCGSAVLYAVLYLVHGFSWKTSAALAGTVISLGLAALLAKYAIASSHLRGLGNEDNLLIQLYLPDVTVTGLMLCGFIIGALGVLNDVTIAQASTINELAEIEPEANPWRLFKGAMKVGRDHIASMVYTLVLSYTGAALPLLLLVSVADRPLGQVFTSDVMATELLRSAIGALALALAVPITTIIAAFTVVGRRRLEEATHMHP
ncbi:YibE/F family protein [Corynebacterium aquilae]|uniref:YibE/F family protein n=1 Tax=Corynebacterium aquilae TaxID=203263 RepID=UPI000951450D|nr:YibE/F family protein [Corynebacterium aquilae]